MGDFNFDIPEDLHDRLRIASIRKKKDMKNILIELIKVYVNKEKIK